MVTLAALAVLVASRLPGDTGTVSSPPRAAWRSASGSATLLLPAYFDTQAVPEAKQAHDSNGIVQVRYGGKPEYNPVTIAQTALGQYARWLATDSVSDEHLFLVQVDWLVTNQTADGLWLYGFAFGGQPVPWWSAMAEGQAISALIRAFRMTGLPVYATAARKALETFTRLQSNRGVVSVDRGFSWYEEYVWPYAPHTLNGFMFSLLGLQEYAQTFADPLASTLYAAGVTTLTSELHRFDTGSWSCYSLTNLTGCNLASISYQRLHIKLLTEFYRLTGASILKIFADRWTSYLAHPPAGV
jgi:hypothetical protein